MDCIESVWADGTHLYFITKAWTIRHRNSVLPLARVKVRVPTTSATGNPLMKYVIPLSYFLHWHPVLQHRIGMWRLRTGCLGANEEDIHRSYRYGPYMEVVTILAMLQGAKYENLSDEFIWWFIIIFSILTLGLLPLIIYLMD